MSLLTVVQRFCNRSGLKAPATAIGSVDKQIIQMTALLNEIVEDLAITRKVWTAQQREKLFTSVNTITQLDDLREACPGILGILRDTMFDRTTHLPVKGPLDEQDWQAAQAVTYSSAYSNFRIIQNRLDFYPQIAAGHIIAFEYKSNALVYDTEDEVFKQYFTKDTDIFSLNEVMLISGLRWLWKKEKGLPYAEEFKTYERNVASFGSTDGTPRKVNMSGSCDIFTPGILIPDSDWNL